MTITFTLGAVSFTVGLVTREVVQALIGFVRSKVSPSERKETSSTATTSSSKPARQQGSKTDR